MTFRRDDDAREQRMLAVEKELEDAQREVGALRSKAARTDAAETEIERLRAEIARISPAKAPVASAAPPAVPRGSATPMAIAIVMVLLGGGLALVRYQSELRAASERESQRGAAERLNDEARAEEEAAQREARAREAAADAREAEAAAVAREAEERALDLRRADVGAELTPIRRFARVIEAAGDAPFAVGQRCHVTLTPAGSDCRADVTCGEESLYPGGPHGGVFPCVVVDHQLTSGADLAPTSSSGDPRILVDATIREITVSDGPPEWSVRLAYDAR
jgi:DNA repair exonuclease SbcCD ATPase subunit